MYSRSMFINSLNKLGNYEVSLVSHRDPQGRKYYSGFIYNSRNDKVAYMTSESYYNAHCQNKFMVRVARHRGDYVGAGINLYADGKNAPMLIHSLIRDGSRIENNNLEKTEDLTETLRRLDNIVQHWDD